MTASPSVDTLNFCVGADTSITYTATFTNVSSSDYTISWNVNGTDSSAVTGLQLTVKIGASGKYKVACTAIREGYPTLMDTIVTYVNVIGSLTDVDGNNYSVLQFGSQCWMTENLRTTKYSDGTVIPLNNSNFAPSRYIPDNDEDNVSTYGYLYNWKAMIGNSTPSDMEEGSIGEQGVCPTGWHLPSWYEWYVLLDYVSGQSEYLCGGNENNIVKALASTTGWQSPADMPYDCKAGYEPESNNATGFNALPAGQYMTSYGGIRYFSKWACFGSASLNPVEGWGDWPYFVGLDYNVSAPRDQELFQYYGYYEWGVSVRCVRN